MATKTFWRYFDIVLIRHLSIEGPVIREFALVRGVVLWQEDPSALEHRKYLLYVPDLSYFLSDFIILNNTPAFRSLHS